MEEVLPLMDKYLVAQEEHKLRTMKRQMVEVLDDGIVDIDITFNDADKDALFQPVLVKFSNAIDGLKSELQVLDKESNLDTTLDEYQDDDNDKENSIINDNNYHQTATMHIHKQSNTTDTVHLAKGLQTEVRQMKTILKSIKNDQNDTQKTITIKNEKLEGLLSDLNIINTIESNNESPKLPTTIDATAALIALQKSNEAHNEQLNDIITSQNDADALLSGLKSLMNIEDIVLESIGDDNIKMIVTSGHIKAHILLDEDKKVYDIQIIESSSKIDIQKIIQDVAMMPTPQDLRYTMFALSSCQDSQIHLQKHIALLRKKCIIKQVTPNTVQVTLGTGISVTLLIHECYPEVPGGVYVDSIIGIGGWDQDELANMKANINASCFNNIVDVFNFLS